MRRGRVSWLAILIGIGIGLALGLFYAWKINPVIAFNTAPWQLSKPMQQQYLVAISLAFARDHDLNRAVERLIDLRLGDQTWRTLADTACELARTNYASTNTGLTAIRSMVQLAQSQGATGCASELLPLYTSTPAPTPTFIRPTPTLIPPPTKTPLPTPGPTFTPATPLPPEATPTASGEFKIGALEAFCNPKNPGTIDIFVQDADGTGLPGIPVEVTSGGDKDDFFTGLKPERDPGFADYQMTAGSNYNVVLPGLSERTRALEAVPCTVPASDGGGKAITSYRVYFRRVAAAK